MQRLLLVLLVVLTGATAGCFEQEAPPAFSAQRKAAADDNEAANVPSCAVEPASVPTDYEGLTNLLMGDVNNDSDGLTGELERAAKWNRAADDREKDLLGRFAPALTDDQQKTFIEAFESFGLANYDGKEKPVPEVRATYRDKIGPLAAALAGIDASPGAIATLAKGTMGVDFARQHFSLGYELLSETPCPARAVKFAGQILSARDPANPYAALYADYVDDELARSILAYGLAQAIVERSAAHQDTAKGLADVRAWLAVAEPYVKDLDGWGGYANLLAVLSSEASLIEYAKTGEPEVKFRYEGDDTIAKQLRAAAGFVAFASADGGKSVLDLMKMGGQGMSALNFGMEKGSKFFGWARLTAAADKLKIAATWYNRAVNTAMQLPEIEQTLHKLLTDPDANGWAEGFDLAGHTLMLASAFIPLPWGIAVGCVGTLALMIAEQLKAPSDDDVVPVLEAVGFDDQQAYALSRADAAKLQVLRHGLGIEPPDVVWLQTRTIDVPAVRTEPLAQIAEATGSKGARILAWLKSIPKTETSGWEGVELSSVVQTINIYWANNFKVNATLCNPLRNGVGAMGTLLPDHYPSYFMPPFSDGSLIGKKESETRSFVDSQMRPRIRAAHTNAVTNMPGGCPS